MEIEITIAAESKQMYFNILVSWSKKLFIMQTEMYII